MMRLRSRALLAGGLVGTAALALVPATAAAPQLVVSRIDNTFSPASQTISLGETVNFSNDPRAGGGGVHNVVWDDNGVKPTPPESVDTPWTAKRTFTTPGLYRYYCEAHGSRNGVGMAGQVLVRRADGSLPDMSSPRIGRVSTAVARGTFSLRFNSSERGKARGRLERIVSGRFRLVGTVTFSIREGANRVRVRPAPPSSGFGAGRYRLRFAVDDTAGNRSAAKTVNVTLR